MRQVRDVKQSNSKMKMVCLLLIFVIASTTATTADPKKTKSAPDAKIKKSSIEKDAIQVLSKLDVTTAVKTEPLRLVSPVP